jgi:hypothetical protein
MGGEQKHGTHWHGKAGMVGLSLVRTGSTARGMARQAWFVSTVTVSLGAVGCGMVRHGRSGEERRERSGE